MLINRQAGSAREVQFDGLVGPTHNYGGLSRGNLASTRHGGEVSNPRAAALQGLAKMTFVRDLGVLQAILPPHDRPSLRTLRTLGFHGSDEEVIAAAAAGDGFYLRVASSASAMWGANAATVAPSSEAADGRVHLTPANLQQMLHRAIEPATTTRVLRVLFAHAAHFVVHDPLPGGGQLADEGAANHLRLATPAGAAHVFAWGRSALTPSAFAVPSRSPARQTREASLALARLHRLDPDHCLFPQQHPLGIDGGAFHTDVLAVGNGSFLMHHELAFQDESGTLTELRRLLGEDLVVVRASNAELPVEAAVAAYPFNSQVLTLPDGTMAIVAPEDAQKDAASRAFLERVVAGGGPVRAVHFVDVRQSMSNGGGPACLRLRVPLEAEEARAVAGHVFLDAALELSLRRWIDRHYRDRLVPGDLADPLLAREGMTALDELTALLGIGTVYDFQSMC
ncbi:MAG: N-succinylarginine dihydrolase [Myxococcales bacterium]|nr:N-succinylarginine dihydrolase [Myxococcales bacterium]